MDFKLDRIEIFDIVLFVFAICFKFTSDRPLVSSIVDIISLICWVAVAFILGYRRGRKS